MVHQPGSVRLPKGAPVDRPGRPGGHGRGTPGLFFRTRALQVASLSALAAVLTPAAAFALQEHVVAPGETLSAIALEYGLGADELAAANGLGDPNHIEVGQVLRVDGTVVVASGATRPARTYTVQPGDTLSGIADTFGLSWAALATANGLDDGHFIVPGQVLHVNVAPETAARTEAAAERTHRVLAGETASGIADEYGISLDALTDANGIADANLVVEGTVLVIPGRTASAAAGGDVRAILRDAAAEFGIDPSLVLAIAWQESGWNQAMVSSAGAVGVMQVIPSSGDWAAQDLVSGAGDWRTDARDNARVGVAILHDLLLATDWDVRLSVASYYQGLRSINESGWYEDTVAYVENVLALAAQF